MLYEKYGEMIIKKDSILYHSSNEQFKLNKNKKMLFLTFHPSEYSIYDKYLHFVKLKRDIRILFMIKNINKLNIKSALNTIIQHPSKYPITKYDFIFDLIIYKLKNENFDGWFSSIDDNKTVEIGLINNFDLYEVIETQNLHINWKFGKKIIENNTIIFILKKWKSHIGYEMCFHENQIILNIPKYFKKIIKKYKKNEKLSGFLSEYAFQLLLDNSIINYF